MIISRGDGRAAAGPRAPERPRAAPAAPTAEPRLQPRPKPANDAPAADPVLVHHRLAALERLAALHDKGALTAEEFAAEKALVLRLPAEELILRAALPQTPERAPSLLGRLFGWKLVGAGLAAGLGLSFYSDPQGVATVAERAGRLIG